MSQTLILPMLVRGGVRWLAIGGGNPLYSGTQFNDIAMVRVEMVSGRNYHLSKGVLELSRTAMIKRTRRWAHSKGKVIPSSSSKPEAEATTPTVQAPRVYPA